MHLRTIKKKMRRWGGGLVLVLKITSQEKERTPYAKDP
jgi:hypothetical protein